ncbi:BCD family MFS transporter [Oscillochloris sp. ZM17-4]|uniref:BCD family MFS transporter n=1 Tax=Oscillochloris sp. ZM17-4 TaxID=2866714 RepID=UPI001C72AF1B|nr:BCD family MFS transporter [Oscillochloris sp. ZM17-4]MBX0326165.1 BCD family MFS transporter [Oscillochloris sp. ZM17-4]
MAFVRFVVKTIRLSIMRIGAGWMFALLTFNFNRVSISDLGAIAVIVTSLIGLHHFISFFQVYWGRFSDRTPILGYRRTPYIMLSSLVASLVFLALPSVAIGLGARSITATLEAFVLIVIFGASMAMNGSASNAMVAEVTTQKERGAVIAVVWATIIISGIISAAVAGSIMPSYDPAKMQQLYNLTPIVVLVTALIGVVGMERRMSTAEVAELRAESPGAIESPLTSFRVAAGLVRDNVQVRAFFLFVLLAIMGIFLQDAILEPFGAEVFGMNQATTAHFQQAWGGGALLGMIGIGVLSSLLPISKKLIATIGGLGVAGGLVMIVASSLISRQSLIEPGLMLMGLGIGLFDVGALAMMMEMTVDGQTGLYMGLWGMAQGLGNGFANIASGALHTGLIETGLLSPTMAYATIFGFEALVMVAAVGILRGISVQEFKGLTSKDIGTVLAMDAA